MQVRSRGIWGWQLAHHTNSAQLQPVILVVEDDDAVRRFLDAVLAKKGYRILSAPDGYSAIEMIREHSAPIHLLVTDVGLPQVNGYDLAQQLRLEHPETRTLYVSGYLEGQLLERCKSDPGAHFLAKPFPPSRLSRLVHEILYGMGARELKAA
jgi:two-component system, cell cycle sensor histidine kinase and response regulator CckA